MASKPTFPDEIMIEIILKLPVKSILRCNTLSKHHYSLTHSKFFIRRHLTLGRLNDQSTVSPIQGSVSFLVVNSRLKVSESLPRIVQYSPNVVKGIICGPVNGLYCVIDQLFSIIAVLNPATRKQFLFPGAPENCNNSEGEQIVTSKFEEALRRCHACGFGYDNITDDYKVVLIYGFPDWLSMVKTKFYILNVSTSKWRNVEHCSNVKASNIMSYVGVFLRDACHWVYVPSRDSGYSILAFDMLTESSRIITFPTVGNEYAWSGVCIVTFNGFLGLVNAERSGNYIKSRSSCFDVWVMKEYSITESWTILYRVSLKLGIVRRFLGIVRNRFYVQVGDGRLVSYNLNIKDEERHGILDKEVASFLPYEESLVLYQRKQNESVVRIIE